MNDIVKRPTAPVRIAAAAIAIVVAGLLGLAAVARMDDLVRPALGETGALVVGCATTLAILIGLGLVSYRALTR